jgi:hypothetical protein
MDKVLMILKLLPVLIEAIRAIEQAVPGEGKGELKLKMLREVLEVVDSSMQTMWPTVAKVVGVLVGTFNSVGTFQK